VAKVQYFLFFIFWPQFDLGEEQDTTHATHGLAPSSPMSKVIIVTLAHFVRRYKF